MGLFWIVPPNSLLIRLHLRHEKASAGGPPAFEVLVKQRPNYGSSETRLFHDFSNDCFFRCLVLLDAAARESPVIQAIMLVMDHQD